MLLPVSTVNRGLPPRRARVCFHGHVTLRQAVRVSAHLGEPKEHLQHPITCENGEKGPNQ